MLKSFAKFTALAVICVLSTSLVVFSGAFEDSIQNTYVYINLKNFVAASLPTAGVGGRIAYDTTNNAPSVDTINPVTSSAAWYRLFHAGSHNDISGVAPTATNGATLATGSTDRAGKVTLTGSGTVILFAQNYANAPFCSATIANLLGGVGTSPISVTGETTTGFTITGLPLTGGVVKYSCQGFYS